LTARPHARQAAALVLAVVAIASCREITVPLQPRRAVALIVVSGNSQSGEIGATLANPLTARVVDDQDNPVPGTIVNFRVTQGGGSVYAGSSISDESGIVRERWALGWVPDAPQEIEVRGVSNATGDSILYARFTATAWMPGVVDKVWVGGQGQALGSAIDWFNWAGWYPEEVPGAATAVLIPGAATAWPVMTYQPGPTIKSLSVRPGGHLNLQFDMNAHPETLSVAEFVDAGGLVDGPGVIEMLNQATLRGRIAHLSLKAKVTLNGPLLMPGSLPNYPDASIDFNTNGAIVVDSNEVYVNGPVDNCNLIMTKSRGRVTSPARVLCTKGTYSNGTITAPQVLDFLPSAVKSTHTVILDAGVDPGVWNTSTGRSAYGNLRTRGNEVLQINTDTLLIKGSFTVESGLTSVQGTLLRVLGNLTIAASAELDNSATIEYVGTFTNHGTLNGNAPVHTP
jgi:hypothetical protein